MHIKAQSNQFLVSLSLVSPNHFLAMSSPDIPSVCVGGETESEPVSLHIRTLIFMIPLNVLIPKGPQLKKKFCLPYNLEMEM